MTEEKRASGEFVEALTYGTLKTLIILSSTRNFKLQTGKLREWLVATPVNHCNDPECGLDYSQQQANNKQNKKQREE